MTEEKKEEKKEAAAPEKAPGAPKTPEAPKAEAPKAEAPKAEAPKAEEPKKEAAVAAPQAAPAGNAPAKEEKKEAAQAKKERPANCEGCKKSIKKKRWYYRDGKFYCTKRCWSSATKKAEKPESAAAAAS